VLSETAETSVYAGTVTRGVPEKGILKTNWLEAYLAGALFGSLYWMVWDNSSLLLIIFGHMLVYGLILLTSRFVASVPYHCHQYLPCLGFVSLIPEVCKLCRCVSNMLEDIFF